MILTEHLQIGPEARPTLNIHACLDSVVLYAKSDTPTIACYLFRAVFRFRTTVILPLLQPSGSNQMWINRPYTHPVVTADQGDPRTL